MPHSSQKIEALLTLKNASAITFSAKGFNCDLKSYQVPGAAFLALGGRALLLYWCGAGKTPMSIGADCKLRELGKVQRTLVVALNGGRYHWLAEYKKYSSLDVRMIKGTPKERVQQWHDAQWADVTISHYEAVRNDIALVEQLNFDLIIYDEASFFRNEGTAIGEVLTRLRDKPDYVFALTATPIQKKLEDLYWIMEKVDADVLGSFEMFSSQHLVKELVTIRTPRRRKFWKVVGYRDVETVQKVMEPYYIRKTQDDVPELDRKRVKVFRPSVLTEPQAKAYRNIVSGLNALGDSPNKSNVLQKFQQLEFACSSTAFFNPSNPPDFSKAHSSKIDDLLFLLNNELQGEKAVVFSKYKVPLQHAMFVLKKNAILFTEITGNVAAEQREQNRISFIENPEVRVCFVTQAAEMSINLHSARYIIFLSEIYNPRRQEQIIGRIDRPFLQKSKIITSIHYSSVGTFEGALHERMEQEKQLGDQVFGNSEMVEFMSMEELLVLMKKSDV